MNPPTISLKYHAFQSVYNPTSTTNSITISYSIRILKNYQSVTETVTSNIVAADIRINFAIPVIT